MVIGPKDSSSSSSISPDRFQLLQDSTIRICERWMETLHFGYLMISQSIWQNKRLS